jgi:hypothetical protein
MEAVVGHDERDPRADNVPDHQIRAATDATGSTSTRATSTSTRAASASTRATSASTRATSASTTATRGSDLLRPALRPARRKRGG